VKQIIGAILLFSLLGFCQMNEPVFQGGLIESEVLKFRVDTVVDDLKVPWAMVFTPDGDMIFTERGGELLVLEKGTAKPREISGVPAVRAKGQGGLLDLELHPQYEENGWLYLSYSAPFATGEEGEGANTALMRARVSEDYQLVDQEVLFKASPNYKKGQHFGGRIEFDREGYVYLSVGDRGGRDEVQSLANYRGKIYRLYDDGRIPTDNPFYNEPGAQKEIFSYGHRNPQGLAIHPETGEIWEHEHGPRGGDEINIVRKGHNYGWPVITYGINYNGTIITEDTVKEGMDQPVHFYRPSIAPCGMDFVDSDLYGEWKGNLLIGSLKFRYLKRVVLDGETVTHQETLLEGMGRVRAVRQAPDGYIYLALEGPGQIVRLIPEKS
jgi:glucose/arabinose dehydrogenase